MAYSYHEGKRKKIFVDEGVFLPTREVIKTRATFLGVEVVVGSYKQLDNLKLE